MVEIEQRRRQGGPVSTTLSGWRTGWLAVGIVALGAGRRLLRFLEVPLFRVAAQRYRCRHASAQHQRFAHRLDRGAGAWTATDRQPDLQRTQPAAGGDRADRGLQWRRREQSDRREPLWTRVTRGCGSGLQVRDLPRHMHHLHRAGRPDQLDASTGVPATSRSALDGMAGDGQGETGPPSPRPAT